MFSVKVFAKLTPEDICYFVAHVCKTTDVPAAVATGIGGDGGGGGETKEAATTNAAKASHHHHQTGGFSQFDHESEEEESDTTCVDDDDDTDNDSESGDDGIREISNANHDGGGSADTTSSKGKANKCVRCAPNRFTRSDLQGVCTVCRKVEQVRGRFLALLKTQYKELIHEGFLPSEDQIAQVINLLEY